MSVIQQYRDEKKRKKEEEERLKRLKAEEEAKYKRREAQSQAKERAREAERKAEENERRGIAQRLFQKSGALAALDELRKEIRGSVIESSGNGTRVTLRWDVERTISRGSYTLDGPNTIETDKNVWVDVGLDQDNQPVDLTVNGISVKSLAEVPGMIARAAVNPSEGWSVVESRPHKEKPLRGSRPDLPGGGGWTMR